MADQWGSPEGRPPEPGPFGPPGAFPPPGPAPASPQPPPVGWEPPPAVYQQYATAPLPGSDRSPEGLRILAIIVSVLKAIPLVLGGIGLALVVALADGFDDVEGFDVFDGALVAIVLLFLVFIGIGALLLIFQVRSALKNQMLTLAIVAGVMAAIDLLALFASVTGQDRSVGGGLLMGVVFAAQVTIAAWAIRLRGGSRR